MAKTSFTSNIPVYDPQSPATITLSQLEGLGNSEVKMRGKANYSADRGCRQTFFFTFNCVYVFL